ncbi:MAG: DMT family transporter [Pseudomonadota bacterium]
MDLRAVVMGLAFALMWASAFSSARMIVVDAPPLAALSVRFVISGVIGVALARAMGQSWHLTHSQWRATIVFGLCQNALYLGLNFVAMQTVEASVAAIIASTMPLLVALAGWAAFGEKLGVSDGLGLVAGIVGVGVIMGARMGTGTLDLFGVGLCVIGVVSLTIATLAMRGASSGGNFLMVVGLQMLIGAVPLAVLSGLTETMEVTWSSRLVLAFLYTTLVPGLAATLVWFLLVDRIGATRAATYHFLTPFFGVAIAALLLDEPLGWQDALGVAIITAGIFAVQKARASRAMAKA